MGHLAQNLAHSKCPINDSYFRIPGLNYLITLKVIRAVTMTLRTMLLTWPGTFTYFSLTASAPSAESPDARWLGKTVTDESRCGEGVGAPDG